jgi:hypothetical protein
MDAPANSGHVVPRKSKARSRVSNGGDILPDVDGRSVVARRYRDIALAILAEQEPCTETRQQLIRRFAASAVLAEQLEAALARGEQIDIQQHALLCSTLTRLAGRIGVDRRAIKDVTPSLAEILAEGPP